MEVRGNGNDIASNSRTSFGRKRKIDVSRAMKGQ
jgi:hypothetical protein